MFYKELLEIQSVDAAVVENFDFWLATLPKKSQKEISVSMVSTQVGIDLATAKQLIEFCKKHGILDMYCIAKCPNCGMAIRIEKDQLFSILMHPIRCTKCKLIIVPENIFVLYQVVRRPDVPEEEIQKAIERRLENVD